MSGYFPVQLMYHYLVFISSPIPSFRGWRLCPDGLAFNPTSQQCEDEFSIPLGSYAKAFVKAHSASNAFARAYSVDPESLGYPDIPKLPGSGIPDPRRRTNNFEGEQPNVINGGPPRSLKYHVIFKPMIPFFQFR